MLSVCHLYSISPKLLQKWFFSLMNLVFLEFVLALLKRISNRSVHVLCRLFLSKISSMKLLFVSLVEAVFKI